MPHGRADVAAAREPGNRLLYESFGPIPGQFRSLCRCIWTSVAAIDDWQQPPEAGLTGCSTNDRICDSAGGGVQHHPCRRLSRHEIIDPQPTAAPACVTMP